MIRHIGIVLAVIAAWATACVATGDGSGDLVAMRKAMVADQIETRGITDPRVLAAMRIVPRDQFVPDAVRGAAYADRPLPIGRKQTISQPYIVALMSALAQIEPGDRVLEVGTGSGYQAAILAEMGAEVWSIEIVEPLCESARERLAMLGYEKVHVRCGDGYAGWPDEAPFDAVLITAAPPRIPAPLKEQLKIGGHLIAPVGDVTQQLIDLERTDDGFTSRDVIPVLFVPMTGEAQKRDR